MTKMLCVVNEGTVINLGPWNNGIDGNPNPMPDGAQEGEFDIASTAEGSFVLASDYRALRAAEYPHLGDQLDALFHAGMFPPEMAALIAAVKAKYPKPPVA